MANRSAYVDRTAFKLALGIAATDTADDATLLAKLEAASRIIDGPYGCNRHFYVLSATRTFSASRTGNLLLPYDLLSITALKTDDNASWNYGYTWSTSDYHLAPFNEWPKHNIIVKSSGVYSFPGQVEGVQINGLWGYGDGTGATPYADAGTDTAEALDTSETGVDVVSGPAFAVGQTILVDSEQMFVTAISTNTLTVVRGVNGTTAAAHDTGENVYIYQYPAEIVEACGLIAVKLFRLKDAPFGVLQGGTGDGGTLFAGKLMDARISELLSAYRVVTV